MSSRQVFRNRAVSARKDDADGPRPSRWFTAIGLIDPRPDEQHIVLIDVATVRKAERLIESCEQRNPATHISPTQSRIRLSRLIKQVLYNAKHICYCAF